MSAKNRKNGLTSPTSTKSKITQVTPQEALKDYEISRQLEKLINLSFKKNSLSEVLADKHRELSQIEQQVAMNKQQAVEDAKRFLSDQNCKPQFTSEHVKKYQEEILTLKDGEEQKLKNLTQQISQTEEKTVKVKAEIEELEVFSRDVKDANVLEIEQLNSEKKLVDMRLEVMSSRLLDSVKEYDQQKGDELEHTVEQVCQSVTRQILSNLDNYLEEELQRNCFLKKDYQFTLDEYTSLAKDCEELESNCLQIQGELFEQQVISGLQRPDSSVHHQVSPESDLHLSAVLDLKFIEYFDGDQIDLSIEHSEGNDNKDVDKKEILDREENLMALGPLDYRLLFVEGKSKEIDYQKDEFSDWPLTFDSVQKFKCTSNIIDTQKL